MYFGSIHIHRQFDMPEIESRHCACNCLAEMLPSGVIILYAVLDAPELLYMVADAAGRIAYPFETPGCVFIARGKKSCFRKNPYGMKRVPYVVPVQVGNEFEFLIRFPQLLPAGYDLRCVLHSAHPVTQFAVLSDHRRYIHVHPDVST